MAGTARLATDDIATEVSRLRDRQGVVSIGGAGLAAAAIAEDLIDEYRLFVNPVILGGATPYLTPHRTPRFAADRVQYLQLPRRLPSLPTHALSLAPRNTSASMWKSTVSQQSKKFL